MLASAQGLNFKLRCCVNTRVKSQPDFDPCHTELPDIDRVHTIDKRMKIPEMVWSGAEEHPMIGISLSLCFPSLDGITDCQLCMDH